MAWYKTGTVSVTASSSLVSGSGVDFATNARVGDAFRGPDGRWYEVTNITSATSLSIFPAYQGTTATGQQYAIAPMQGYVKASADILRQAVNDYAGILTSIKPWATASTPTAALDALGFSTVGKSIATAANAAAARTTLELVKTTSATDTTLNRVWRTNDLVKVTDNTDGTPGRVMLTGSGGLLGNAPTYPGGTLESLPGQVPCGHFSFAGTFPGSPVSPMNGHVIMSRRGNSFGDARLILRDTDSTGVTELAWIMYRTTGVWQTAEVLTTKNSIKLGNTVAQARATLDTSVFPAYTVATVPNASANTNKGIIVTDAAGVGRRPFWSDGTNWKDSQGVTLS